MTERKPICPACGGETHREGMHCTTCLEAYMATMTPVDWQQAFSEVVDRIIGDGEITGE